MGQRRGHLRHLDSGEKTDRQGLTEITSANQEEVGLEEGEEGEEEDPLPVYNPHGEEAGDVTPYYDTTSDLAFIDYPLTQQ